MRPEPLRRAAGAQRRAARQGFDWPKRRGGVDARLWRKLAEEVGELKAVQRRRDRAEDELGDLLFMAVNLARHLGLDPGRALGRAVRKFERRLAYVLAHTPKRRRGESAAAHLARMELNWIAAKRRERRRR